MHCTDQTNNSHFPPTSPQKFRQFSAEKFPCEWLYLNSFNGYKVQTVIYVYNAISNKPPDSETIKSIKKFIEDNPNLVIDGELYNHELKDDFNKITSLVRKVKPTPEEATECQKLVEYHVYDMVWTDGVEPYFKTRMDFIEAQNFELPIVTVETKMCDTQEELDELYSQYTEDGYEGQMVRNNTVYENKRSKNLLKRKEFITEEFDVIEVLEGSGNWAGYAKHFVLTDGTETFKSGVRGNQATLKALLEQEEKPTWVTCRFFERSVDNIPRFPVVIDWGIGERND